MNIENLLPYAITWAVLAAIVIGLIAYRRKIANMEDDTIHVLDGDLGAIPQQQAVAKKLEKIDRWGKLLTIVTALYGLGILAYWVYQSFVSSGVVMG